MPSRINDLPKRLDIVSLAMEKSYKEIADIAGVNERTIDGWRKSTIPHERKFYSFCKNLGLESSWFFDELDIFCNKIGEKYGVDSSTLRDFVFRKESTSGELLQSIRSIHGRKWMEMQFKENFKGYWVGMHYWEKGGEKGEKKIFCHLFNFDKYDREKNSIKFYLASARTWKEDGKWSYQGDIIVSMTKLYLLAETMRRDTVELLVIVATRPYTDFENILGIMLAPTTHNERSFSMSKPAASRILLQKVPDGYSEEELLKEYIGIYDEDHFDDGLKSVLDNVKNEDVGVLFPYFDGERGEKINIDRFWDVKKKKKN